MLLIFLYLGTYCGQEGLPNPEGPCERGYYCPLGQNTPTPGNYTCPEGHFCLEGYGDPEPCPSGTYQNEVGRWDCKTCEEGFYCNATFGPVVHYMQTVCPEGHYCPAGTKYDVEFPCPRGTFNNRTGNGQFNGANLCYDLQCMNACLVLEHDFQLTNQDLCTITVQNSDQSESL